MLALSDDQCAFFGIHIVPHHATDFILAHRSRYGEFHDTSEGNELSWIVLGGFDDQSQFFFRWSPVTLVRFGTEPRDTTMHVDLEITRVAWGRVRRNSVAEIASKGLLGDKALDITMGDPAQPQVAEGGTLVGRNEDAIGDAIRNASGILTRATSVLDNIVAATRPLANPQLAEDLTTLVHDLRVVGDSVANPESSVSQLLRDRQMVTELRSTLTAARNAVQSMEGAAGQVNALARDARTGRGLVHALVYDERGGQVIGRLGEAAGEMSAITRDIRTGNGGLHQLIYGDELSGAAHDVHQITTGVRDIVTDVRRGRGTIGALLVDPSLYEDLKSLVGNVSRNEVLRAMVRYSIHANDRDAQPTPAVRATPRAP